MTTSDEAVTASKQHTQPCHDCPFARTAINGWLGSMTVEEWLQLARGDEESPCHVISNQQCAGLAIFRRNMCKLAQPPALHLPADHDRVFSSPQQFAEHHQRRPRPGQRRKRK